TSRPTFALYLVAQRSLRPISAIQQTTRIAAPTPEASMKEISMLFLRPGVSSRSGLFYSLASTGMCTSLINRFGGASGKPGISLVTLYQYLSDRSTSTIASRWNVKAVGPLGLFLKIQP